MFNLKLVPGLIFAVSGLISCASTSSPTSKFNVDTKDRAFMDRLQKTIQGIDSHQITLVGYADSVGSKKRNSDLSLKRAESVQAVLQPNNFLASGKIQTEGMGEEKPIATNLTRQGRSQNRRVDLVLTAASQQ
jgi:outer membrane protein OmpA-like peptidoglycan-associated protein